VLCQERRYAGQEGGSDGCIRGMAILGFAPERPGPIDAERGEDALLQVGPLVLALAMGHRQGHLLLLRKHIIAVHRHGSRVKVDGALVEAKDLIRPYGTGREDLHRARIIEPISDPPHGVIITGARRDGLAQQQGGIVVSEELFQAVQGAASAQGIEEHAKHNGPWIESHLGRHDLIDHLDEAHLVRLGFHHGQRLDLVRFDRREHETHTTLQSAGVWGISSHAQQHTTVGVYCAGDNAPKKISGSPSKGVRNVCCNALIRMIDRIVPEQHGKVLSWHIGRYF